MSQLILNQFFEAQASKSMILLNTQQGKRFFLMTPIHHHFELKGIKEEIIVENFWKVNILLVFLGIVLEINL